MTDYVPSFSSFFVVVWPHTEFCNTKIHWPNTFKFYMDLINYILLTSNFGKLQLKGKMCLAL